MPAAPTDRLRRAIAAIDAANAADPHMLVVRGEPRPKELAHAELASAWVARLVDAPSEELVLAARAHHLERWAIPRASHPMGRAGYHRWRRALQAHHAARAGEILAREGYPEAAIARVQSLLRKEGLGRGDAEAQAFEDALCLVFLETQLVETAAKLDDEAKALDVLRKTLRKMSTRARELAGALPLDEGARALVERALESGPGSDGTDDGAP
ncbi:MAG: DUF4202 domain-containing protein [Myxococcales bacterium]|nr:DUF4202 domain-containing protein [Myxococcales bacterium]